jgi:hypothetical protein
MKRQNAWIRFSLENIVKEGKKHRAIVKVALLTDKDEIIEGYREMWLDIGDTVSMPIKFTQKTKMVRIK